MARQPKRNSRAARRREDVALKLMVLGGMFAVMPLFLSKSPLGKAFAALGPLGLVMLAAGGILMWLARRSATNGTRLASPQTAPSAGRSRRPASVEPAPVGRLVTGVDQMIDEAYSTRAPKQAPARPEVWGAAVFDVIEWRRFEAVIEALFRQAGFETTSKSHGPDGGVDVWLHKSGEPVGLVQCKHWQGKRVGVDKIRELRGVMAAHNVRRGQFATSATFTPEAEAFARENGVMLHDANGLLNIIAKRTPEQQKALLDIALEGDYWRPTCVNCGVKMVERSPRNGGAAFWGCQNYPRCKTMMPMRGA